ncbi:MAG: dockerin type I domain-containing protein, partial [Bacteroidetes bacterium]|nr:dockerin type I domain-containing protein [Bacteroidota bacterium]
MCDTAKRDTLNLTGCGNVIYNGNTYASSNIKNDTLKTTLGCDSIYRVANITVKPTSASYHSATICANALPYSWNGNAYNAAGNYTAHFTNAVGCDSTANLKLIVNALPVISLNSSSNCLNTANLNLTGASNALQIVWQNNGATVNTTMLTAAAFGTTVAGGNPTSTLPNALNGPSSVFVDKNGVLYVGDLNNARIQRFAVGNLNATTVAGGYGIGVGLNQINSPSGVMVNDSNNVYVGDFGNHRVAKWLPNATIGIVVAGGNGSTNTSNAFNGVADIFVDAANNIYVADQNNHRIQKWTPGATSGVTVAGGNGAGSANNQINLPTAVFVDAVGNVYVGDYGNKRVTKWAVGATSGVTVAGGNGAGAANNQIDLLAGLYVDAIGNVYVADQNNHRIQKWTVGAITGITVAGGNGAGSNANQFKYPKDIYIDTAGAMYVPDNWNQRVQKWLQTINTSYIPTTAGVYTAIVTNNAGCTATSNVIAIAANVSPAISITANKLNVCAATKVRFNATISNGGSSPVYQWKRNGVNVGINSNTYLDSSFNAFDSVWCVLTSNATCVISPTVKSNVVQLIATQVPAQQNINLQGCTSVIYNGNSYFNSTTVNDTLKTVDGCDSVYKFININVTTPSSPANSIVPSFNNICFGAKIIFTATSSIQGANPIYKWYKNGLIVGTNASSYTDSLLNNQDSIWCVLTISETCVTANNIKSNVVKMNVSLAITGNIKTPTGNAISKVALYRKGSITDMQIVNSKYNSSCIDIANSVTLRPTKNNDVTKANGVTSVDVLLTQRHILNTTKLNSAYKLIAADVDGNKTINSVDVLRMKRLILGTYTTFTKTVGTVKTDRLWEFVDSSYAFPDTTNPFPFKDSISFTNLTSIKTNQSFIGVKLGDVNYDWNASMARQSVNSLQLTVDRKEQVSTIRYTLSTINFKDI